MRTPHALSAGRLDPPNGQLISDRVLSPSGAVDNYELLAEPFGPAPEVVFSPGGYSFVDVEGTYPLGAQHRFFWSGGQV